MDNQTLIQVRVNTELKNQAAKIFEDIGIDIPTAVRMFLKASVKKQGLPFAAHIQDETDENRINDIMLRLNKIEETLSAQSALSSVADTEMTTDPVSIIALPLANGEDSLMKMYIQLISKVPSGCITCWRDMNEFLGKLYGIPVQDCSRILHPTANQNYDQIPYWRVVTERGVLKGFQTISKEEQRDRLTQEGLPVVQRGRVPDSFKVDNYKSHMYDFRLLKVIKK